MDQVDQQHKRRKGRSPAYPAIGLKEAIERAYVLLRFEGRHPAPIEVVIKHWGYAAKSSTGLVIVAAMKRFGLIEDMAGATRRIGLSDVGYRLAADEKGVNPERQRLLQEAALKPVIHAELWERYGKKLPSDDSLGYELKTERRFTDAGIKEFIPQFRATLDYAGLLDSDKVGAGNAIDQQPAQHGASASPPTFEDPFAVTSGANGPTEGDMPARKVTQRVLHLPLPGSDWAVLHVPYPMTEEAWQQMLAVLQAMKPGVVVAGGSTSEAPEADPEHKKAAS